MSRQTGSNNFAGTLEILAGGPIDARLVVPTKADLTVSANFPYPYVGMIVSVSGEGKAYILTATPVTDEDNWEEVGSGGSSVPPAGETGQALVKRSATDGDVEWKDIPTSVVKGYAYQTPVDPDDFLSAFIETVNNSGKAKLVWPVPDSVTKDSRYTPAIGCIMALKTVAEGASGEGQQSLYIFSDDVDNLELYHYEYSSSPTSLSIRNNGSSNYDYYRLFRWHSYESESASKITIESANTTGLTSALQFFISSTIPHDLTGLDSSVDINIIDTPTTLTFYKDSAHTIPITPEEDKLYIDLAGNDIYIWDGEKYVVKSPAISSATDITYSNSTSGMAATNVQAAVDELKNDIDTLPAVYIPAGSVAFASLPSLTAGNVGKVVNVTDAFTTTADFVEGSGKSYPAGTNVAIVDTGSSSSHVYKYDAMSGMVDISGKADKVSGATSGHLAALNSSGNLTDSGKALSDLQAKLTAGDGITIDSSTNTISADVNYLIGAYDIYDSTERVVGYYFRKPLYRKTISFGTLPNATIKNVAHGISNVDRIVSAHGYAYTPTNLFFIPLQFSANQTATIAENQTAALYLDRTNIYIATTNDLSPYTESYITIEYTKTTDSTSSVSYGHENQYSTSEQIVGTWIDGKPLYQKTVVFGALPNTTTKSLGHGISNLGTVVDLYGMAFNSSNNNRLPLPYVDTNTISSNIHIIVNDTDIKVTTGIDRSALTAYITIKYTKTT